MAVDKNKIVAEATRFVQKGQLDKALKAYEKILAEDKKEVRTLLKVGEIQQKKGDSPAAAATFNQVAEIYGEQGFFLKAVAVYKQIAKLTPADVRVNEKLAGLYQQLGLLNDATNQLQAVAAAHEKAGDQGRHLDVLRRLLDLDPENVVTCQRLGDLYAKANRGAEALELYRRAAAHLKENKRGDEYVKLAERIYQLTPDDLKLARELAQEYLARGDTKKALGKLQVCHGADKQDVDTLRLMAQAFRDLGQVSKTIAVYRALARVYAERGRRDEAVSTWRMVQELLPDDPEARDEIAASGSAGGSVAPLAPARPPPSAPPPPFTPQPGASQPVGPPAGPPVVPVRTGTPAPRPAVPRPPEVRRAPPQVARPAPGATSAPPGPVSRILTETDVYLKYGLHAKALEHVEKALETDAGNPDVLERIRDIRDILGDRPGAAEAAERAVKALLERGDEARVAHAAQRLRELDPSHAEVSVEPSAREPAPAPVAAADELPLPDDEPALEVAVDPEPHETIVVVPPDEEGPRVVAGPEGPPPVMDDEAPGAIESYSGIPLEEESPPVPELPVPEPLAAGPVVDDEPPPTMVLGDDSPLPVDDDARQVEPAFPADEADPSMDVVVEEIETDLVEEVAPPEPPLLPPAALAAPEHPWEPLEAELEEVEFYERQGLLEEALLAVRELAASHPGHPAVQPVLARVEQLAALESDPNAPPPSMPPAQPRPPAAPERDAYASTGTTGIFDLGAELSAELGPELTPTPTGEFQYSVADVFDQFKRGLEKTVRPDDSATKYDLGIAFQEMGMLDEALEQFRSALAGGDGRREVEILNMIGVCLGLKGRPGEAIEAYRQALASGAINPEAAKAIHFELGMAHEALGEPQEALWYFQRVAQGDPAYRGVAERVSRLGGGRGVAPGAGKPSEDPVPPPAKKARKR
jgi:tetratricopeptide (TPR) repeat protein